MTPKLSALHCAATLHHTFNPGWRETLLTYVA